jgi:hypothetical protein
MKRRSLIPMLMLAMVAACSDSTAPGGSGPFALLAAKQRWQARTFHDYRLTLQVQCFCAHTNPMRVFVAHDTLLGAIDLVTGETLPRGYAMTVDQLFDVVHRAQQAGTPLEVTYDGKLGFPRTIVDNGPAMAYDGGARYIVSELSEEIFSVAQLKARRPRLQHDADLRPR